MLKSLLIIPIFFYLLSSPVHGLKPNVGEGETNQAGKYKFVSEFGKEIASECAGKVNIVILLKGVRILCVSGLIRSEGKQDRPGRSYSIVYLNSGGGEIRQSWSIGEEIYKNGALGIVDSHCHSSCGTYLLPSLKRVFIMEGAVMSMHTNLPRLTLDFMKSRRTKTFNSIIDHEIDSEMQNDILSVIKEFDNFYQNYVIEELDFFRKINTDPSYTIRYREVYRTLVNRDRYNCKPASGLHLLIGPKYLSEFKVKVVSGWFPEKRSEFLDLLPNASKTDVLIYDFDDHPFWTPELGLVSPEDCMGTDE